MNMFLFHANYHLHVSSIVVILYIYIYLFIYLYFKKVTCSRYRPGVAMTAALEEGEWSAARPGRTSPPGKTRYPFYRRLGGPQRRSGRAENLFPTGIRSRTVQPVVSRYTDWATRPTLYILYIIYKHTKPLRYNPEGRGFDYRWGN